MSERSIKVGLPFMSFLDLDKIICLAEIHNRGVKEAIVEGKRILVSDGDDIQSTVINARA